MEFRLNMEDKSRLLASTSFSVSPLDRVTQIAGVAFDACGWEIWPYLTAGASIHFPNDETRFA